MTGKVRSVDRKPPTIRVSGGARRRVRPPHRGRGARPAGRRPAARAVPGTARPGPRARHQGAAGARRRRPHPGNGPPEPRVTSGQNVPYRQKGG
nr:MAG: hypothetical protein DIU60_06135 [Actinomycetota bacterium]